MTDEAVETPSGAPARPRPARRPDAAPTPACPPPASPSPAPALQLEAVAALPSLAPVRCTLAPGDITLLLGPAGAGKTLALEVCALLRRPASGDLRVLGEDPAALSPAARAALRRRIGWAPSTPVFLDRLSLSENLAAPLRLAGVAPQERRAQAAEVLDWLDLGHRADAPPARLSLGERRRAAFARAVIAGPELVLLDDPVAGLDASAAALVVQMLRALADHGAAILIGAADPALARDLGRSVTTLQLDAPAAQPSGAPPASRAAA